jgi:hypothetical protein
VEVERQLRSADRDAEHLLSDGRLPPPADTQDVATVQDATSSTEYRTASAQELLSWAARPALAGRAVVRVRGQAGHIGHGLAMTKLVIGVRDRREPGRGHRREAAEGVVGVRRDHAVTGRPLLDIAVAIEVVAGGEIRDRDARVRGEAGEPVDVVVDA